jgi:hypothetical protein
MEVDERIIAMMALKESTHINAAAVSERVKTMFPWIARTIDTPSLGTVTRTTKHYTDTFLSAAQTHQNASAMSEKQHVEKL